MPGIRTLPRDADPCGGSVTVTPRAAGVVRPFTPVQNAKVHVVAPAKFADAQEIGDRLQERPAGHRQPAGGRPRAGPAHDRLLQRRDLRPGREHGQGRRPGVPAHPVQRRGFGRGEAPVAGARPVPVLARVPSTSAGSAVRARATSTCSSCSPGPSSAGSRSAPTRRCAGRAGPAHADRAGAGAVPAGHPAGRDVRHLVPRGLPRLSDRGRAGCLCRI